LIIYHLIKEIRRLRIWKMGATPASSRLQPVHFQPIGIARQLNAGDREFAESGILKTHVLFVRKSERTASRVGRVSPVFGNRTVTNAVKWEVKNGKTGIGLWRLGSGSRISRGRSRLGSPLHLTFARPNKLQATR